ncbi:MAG: hypothetical protein QXI32_01365 [Candidatus Bathyarchaeia archaeon]
MKVTVKFTQNIRALTQTDQTVFELREGAHLSDLLQVLIARYGEKLAELLYTSEQSPIDTWPSVIVDGKAMTLDPVTNVTLKEGSLVVLLSAGSGG